MYKSPLAYSRKYQLWRNIDNDDDHDVLLFNVNWVVFQLNSFAPCRLMLVEGLSAEVLDCYMKKKEDLIQIIAWKLSINDHSLFL